MIDRNELPLGFGMALAQHPDAMKNFSNMSDAQQKDIITQVHNVKSKKEMQSLVASLCN